MTPKLLFFCAKFAHASLGLSFLHFRLPSSRSVILVARLFLLFFTGPLLFSSHATCVFCLPVQLRGSISLWYDAHSVTPDKQSHVLPSTYNTQISWEQTLVSPLSHPLLIKASNSGVFPLRYVDRWCKVADSNKINSHSNYCFWVFTSCSLVGRLFSVVLERHADSFFRVTEFGSDGSRTSISFWTRFIDTEEGSASECHKFGSETFAKILHSTMWKTIRQ